MRLSVTNLSKSYKTPDGTKNVLNDLSLEVAPGEVYV